MDKKYIENLGMSQHIDEGLWDRLRSRAAGYYQMAKNIGGGTTDTGAANFNVLFKKFLDKSSKTILDFVKVIRPYKTDGKLTPEQEKEVRNLIDLYYKIFSLSTAKITEANVFTRPFSALGAQASGNPNNIIASYKNMLKSYYDSFINDLKKLNIDPNSYLKGNISKTKPEAFDFLDNFEKIVSPSPTVKPNVAPGSQPETPPETPQASEPSFSAKDVSLTTPSGEIPPTTISTDKPAPTPAPTQEPSKAASSTASPSDPSSGVTKLFHDLTSKAITKIVNISRDFLSTIGGYIHRDQWKAKVVFPTFPFVEFKKSENMGVRWILRYTAVKDIGGHGIDVLGQKLTRETPDQRFKVTNTSDSWIPFIRFDADDVIDDDGNIRGDFDVVENIKKTNPKIGKYLSDLKIDPGTNKKMATVLSGIIEQSVPKPERGKRQIKAGEKVGSEEDMPADQRLRQGEEMPLGDKPEVPTTTTGEVPPEKLARVQKIAQEPEKPKGKVPKKTPTSKVKPKPKKPLTKSNKPPVVAKESFIPKLRDFFPPL